MMDQQPFYQQEPVTPMPAVWPPAPQGSGLSQVDLQLPFQARYEYVQGSMSDFRMGTLDFNPDGIMIDGKVVTRMEIQVPVLIAFLVLRIGFLIAWAAMEYGFRKPQRLQVNWDNVEQVVLNKKKSRMCLVYSAPNYKGTVKRFSLTTQTTPAYLAEVEMLVAQRIPDRVREGKMRRWISPRSWIFLGGAAVYLIVIAVIAAMAGTSH